MHSYRRLGAEFRVNLNAAGDQSQAAVTANAYGGFQIYWTDSAGDSSVTGIRAQVFNADRSRFAPDFLVNASTALGQDDSSGVYLTGGGWNVALWTDSSGVGDASGTGIKAQFMDGVGGKSQGEYLINTTTAGNQYDASAASLGLNNYVVVWTDESGGVPVIRGQLIATRTKSGGELLISTGTAPATEAAVVTRPGSGFLVVWRTDDGSVSAIHGQLSGASSRSPLAPPERSPIR
jgi:hypothetical protein